MNWEAIKNIEISDVGGAWRIGTSERVGCTRERKELGESMEVEM